MARNPVMFVVEVGSVLTTSCSSGRLGRRHTRTCSPGSSRPGCGSPCCSPTSPRRWPRDGARRRRARCARPAPRRSRTRRRPTARSRRSPSASSQSATSASSSAGELIPGDGEIDRGHRHRRRVGDHRRVGAGDPRVRRRPLARSPAARACSPTRSSCASPPKPGETFLDRMIALVEGADRQKTPNEIALNILLAGPDDHLPARRRDAAAVRDLLGRRAVDRSCSSRCSCA